MWTILCHYNVLIMFTFRFTGINNLKREISITLLVEGHMFTVIFFFVLSITTKWAFPAGPCCFIKIGLFPTVSVTFWIGCQSTFSHYCMRVRTYLTWPARTIICGVWVCFPKFTWLTNNSLCFSLLNYTSTLTRQPKARFARIVGTPYTRDNFAWVINNRKLITSTPWVNLKKEH